MSSTVIPFNDVIAEMVSDAFTSVIATKNALKAHNQLYHLQMAIKEHGEEAVVKETARILQERYRCTYSDATIDAAHRVRACLEMVSGEDTFKTVRDNLNS